MADVDHTNLNTSQVHEPKHISASTSADAGKVITPTSSGASELRNLTADEVGIITEHGQMGAQESTEVISLTAASDSNMYTTSDYVELNSTRITMAANNLEGITFDNVNNRLTVAEGGTYKINIAANLSTDTNNNIVALRNTINGTANGFVIKRDFVTLDRVENMSSPDIVTLNAGDTVSVSIAAEQTSDVTITDIYYIIERL